MLKKKQTEWSELNKAAHYGQMAVFDVITISTLLNKRNETAAVVDTVLGLM